MKWKFRINWRTRIKKQGGSLPGLYDYFEAKKLTRKLRKQYPERLFWMGNTKSIPTTKRDEIEI